MTTSAADRTTGTRRAPVVVEEVLDRAAELFMSLGYHRTRMQDIADAFGVTHAALYYHFSSKQDILAQVNMREIRGLIAGAQEVIAGDAPPEEQLLLLLERHLRYVATSPAFAMALFENDRDLPEDSLRAIVALRREYSEHLVGCYERARVAGDVPDVPATVAVSLLIGAVSWTYRWYRPSRGFGPEVLTTQGMAFLRGVLGGGDARA